MAQLENAEKELLYSGSHVEVLIERESIEPSTEYRSPSDETRGSLIPTDFFDIPLAEGLMTHLPSPDINRLSVTLPEAENTSMDSSEAYVNDQKFTDEEIMIQREE